MSAHFPALIVIIPLVAAFFAFIGGLTDRRWCLPISIAALGLSLLAAIGLLTTVLDQGAVHYHFAGWLPPVGIAYQVDHLNGLILVVVAVVALINLIGSESAIRAAFEDRLGMFCALYLLFVTGLFGIVATGDAFNLFVLLEITSLTGYALIGLGKSHAPLAALNYIFIGTMGASFYLLGVGYLYLATGSLNMADIASLLPQISHSKVVLAAFIICLTGLFMKMALFPLHTWMPNAYAQAPSTVGSLVAPLTTKVMIYVMIRVVFSVFTPEFAFGQVQLSGAMVWLAIIAMVMGSLLALSQTNLKRMLAFIIVAEVGYMVGGFWLGNRQAISGAILHIVNDAAMTLCVFMAAGALGRKFKNDQISGFKGAFAKMPFTMAAMAAGGLSIIGVPPSCGFFSKWYLISGGIAAGHYAFVAALVFSSLVNAVLFFRLFEIGFFEISGEHHGHHHFEHGTHARHEVPFSMIAAMLAVAAGLVVLGLFSGSIVTNVIQHAIPGQIL